jgi:hypothetical protein
MKRLRYIAAAVFGVGAIVGLWIMVQSHMLEPSAILRREINLELSVRWYRYEFAVGDGGLEQEWSTALSDAEAQSVRSRCSASQRDSEQCVAHVSHQSDFSIWIFVKENQILISRIAFQ